MDIAGLILGILSSVLGFVGVGLIFGIIGIPLSAIGCSKAKKENRSTGIAIAGIVLNSIGIAFSLLMLLFYFSIFSIFLNTNLNTPTQSSEVLNLNGINKNQSDFDSNSEYRDANIIYATFTEIGYMRLESKDKHTIFINIVFEYNQNINGAKAELISKTDKIKDFFRQYFANKNYAQLKPENELNIKHEIMELLNSQYLENAIISGILFLEFDVSEY